VYAFATMDERELANTVVEIVDRAAYRNAVHQVACVHIAIGGLRGIDLAALDAAFATVARGTVAEGARLEVRVLPVTRRCHNCGTNFEAAANDCECPHCGHCHTDPITGEEVRVLDMEVEDSELEETRA
jgi:hydrogenase nickel incorporation protein HypA/HybF